MIQWIIMGMVTHVAGIVAAEGNNGVGVSGICWKASIMAIKVLTDEGWGYSADITRGIYFAVDNGAKVINMSLGGVVYDSSMFDAIRYAKSKNVLIMVAAGNSGQCLYSGSLSGIYPCMYYSDNIICVGALDQVGEFASFTNYSKDENVVHVYAPGVNILSTITSTTTVPLTGNLIEEKTWQKTDNNWAIHTTPGYTVASNPANFDFSATYKPNLTNSYMYSVVDCRGYNKVMLQMEAYIDVESNYDGLYISYTKGEHNPSVDQFVSLAKEVGRKNEFKEYNYLLQYCSNSLCTIAYMLMSDGLIQYTGVALKDIRIYYFVPLDDKYGIHMGTSMATSHVTGTAALVWAINPEYSYAKVREKILNGAKRQIINGYGNSSYPVRKLDVWGALTHLIAPANLRYKKIK